MTVELVRGGADWALEAAQAAIDVDPSRPWAQRFVETMPYRPLAADDYTNGVYRMSRAAALQRRHVQHSPSGVMLANLVIDVDEPDAAQRAFSGAVKPPSLIVTNRANGHAHLLYMLADPVCMTDAGRPDIARFALRVREGIRDGVGGDRGYGGQSLVKNPFHPDWEVFASPPAPILYALRDLVTDRTPHRMPTLPRRYAQTDAAGRAVACFNTTRLWAYGQWWAHGQWDRPRAERAEWDRHVLAGGRQFADDYRGPGSEHGVLPFREVRKACLSISTWITEHFDAQTFRDRQRRRGAKGLAAGAAAKGGAKGGRTVTPARLAALETARAARSAKSADLLAAIVAANAQTV